MSIKRLGALPVLVLLFIAWSPAQADPVVDLFDSGFNVDGVTFCSDPGDGCDFTGVLPAGLDDSGFDFGTGLGSLSLAIAGIGPHTIIAYFDHEIDEAINTFFNEIGSTSGVAAAGQSWEIDEPGFFGAPPGDIFDNFVAGFLDNTVGMPGADDVAMAMGFDFDLLEGETALVEFFLSTDQPEVDFFLAQLDPDSQFTIYFWGELTIRGGDVPEPGTLGLLGLGLLGLVGTRRLRKRAAG